MDEQELKERLNPEQYRIMRQKGTEMPYISKYWDHDESGLYFCAACGNKLFSSLAKFNAGEGWPTFRNPTSERDVDVKEDGEVVCRKCKSHIGEMAGEGEQKYYRINSVCLDFKEVGIEFEEDDGEEDNDEKKKKNQKKTDEHARDKARTMKTVSLAVGGVAVGALLGAGLGILFCQTSEVNFERKGNMPSLTTPKEPMAAPKPVSTSAHGVVLPRGMSPIATSTNAAPSAGTTGGGAVISSPRSPSTATAQSGTTSTGVAPSGSGAGTTQNVGTTSSNDGTLP